MSSNVEQEITMADDQSELEVQKTELVDDTRAQELKTIEQLLLYGAVPLLEKVLSHMDPETLYVAESVSNFCHEIIVSARIWEKTMKDLALKPRWKKVVKTFNFEFALCPSNMGAEEQSNFYRNVFSGLRCQMDRVEQNWLMGLRHHYILFNEPSCSEDVLSVYMNEKRIVSGHCNGTVRVWSRPFGQLKKVYIAHRSPVTSVTFTKSWIATGSALYSIAVHDWNGNLFAKMVHHESPITCLRAHDNTLISSCMDGRLVVWDMTECKSPTELIAVFQSVCVHACDIGENFFVSGNHDGKLKVWTLPDGHLIRVLREQVHSITCLRYRHPLVVTGSDDCTITLWDIEMGHCLRILRGHNKCISTVDFNEARIVSATMNGVIKVWNMKAVQNPKTDEKDLCTVTHNACSRRINALTFDDILLVFGNERNIVCYEFDK